MLLFVLKGAVYNNMRRLGSRDLKPRKIRSDRGKKHKTYAGKPCKRKSNNYQPRAKGNKKYIKIWVWKIDKMSADGYKRFHKNIRRKMSQEIWIPQNKDHVYLVHVNEINTKEKLCKFICDRYYSGTWVVMGFTNKKNKYHCSPKKKARIVIKETDEGNVVKSFKDYGMYRYWFWGR